MIPESASPDVRECLQALSEFGALKEQNIWWHEPVLTSDAQAKALEGKLGEDQQLVKNLFLKQKKTGVFVLIVLRAHIQANLDKIAKAVHMKPGTLRFADEIALRQILKLGKGEVTPLAIKNDTENEVRVYLDKGIQTANEVIVHPLTNEASVALSTKHLQSLLKSWNHDVEFIECE